MACFLVVSSKGLIIKTFGIFTRTGNINPSVDVFGG